MRSGLWMSGSGGAGLITARKADGTWSPPSGIILHTAELAFVMGVDIYDCVLVINSVQTLEFFTRPRLILGVDVNLDVGPLVPDGGPEPEIKWKEISDTVLTYVKARGRHQAVQLDGSLVVERCNENERFYRSGVSVLDILAGNVPKNVPEIRPLFEVIKAAEGRSDYDKALMSWLAQQPAPGDADIECPASPVTTPPKSSAFGIPDANDPDPFGIISLEMAGIEIREAGSKSRPASTQLDYHPNNPMSPISARFRQSIDTFVSRSNRGSVMSSRTQTTAMTDGYAPTDVASTADTTYTNNSDDGKDGVDKLPTVVEPDEVDYTKVDTSILERLKRRTMEPRPAPALAQVAEETEPAKEEEEEVTETPKAEAARPVLAQKESAPEPSPISKTTEPAPKEFQNLPTPQSDSTEDADDEDDEDDEDEEEPIICEVEVATATAQPARSSLQAKPQVTQVAQVIQAKGAIVTIPKRVPPPLPAKSPARMSRGSLRSEYSLGGDVASLKSPKRSSFMSIESRIDEEGAASLNEVLASSSESSQKGEESQAAAPSPKHQRNSSSVCTAVAVASSSSASIKSQEVPSSETSTTVTTANSSSNSSVAFPSPVPSSASSQPALEPASSPSSTEDDSDEREPKTPKSGKEMARFEVTKKKELQVTEQEQEKKPVKIVGSSSEEEEAAAPSVAAA